jgi:hypothetical protein
LLYKCSKHHSSLAGWRCGSCSATLCADCTGQRTAGATWLEICSRCGGLARQIKVLRSELHPFSLGQLLGAVGWPFSKLGLLSIFASAVVMTAFAYLGRKGSIIVGGVMIAYLFQIVRHTAHGGDDVPGPEDFRGYFEDVVSPSFRLVLALAWIWVPAVAWMYWHRGPAVDPGLEQRRAVEQALRPGGPGLSMRGMKVITNGSGSLEVMDRNAPPPPPSPEQMERMKAEEEAQPPSEEIAPEPAPASRGYLVPILLVIFGIAIAPMSLIASSLKTPLRVAANPIVLAGYAIKLGRDYALLLGFCLAAVVVAFVLRIGGTLLTPPIFFGQLPMNIATVALGFVAFRGIGLLVRARGSDLGYGGEEGNLVPVLGDEQPRYVIREAEPVVPAAAPPSEDPAAQFARMIAQKDVDGCVALLEQSWQAIPREILSASGWMDLAKAAHQRGKGKPAAAALRRCIDSEPQGPMAPKAMLLAARTYDELLGDRKTSDRLLQDLLKRFPSTQEGAFASKRLAAAVKKA